MNSALVKHSAGIAYVRIDTLPQSDREPFAQWIFRQTRPVIPNELDANGQPTNCAYAWDYARWLAEGRPTTAEPYDS